MCVCVLDASIVVLLSSLCYDCLLYNCMCSPSLFLSLAPCCPGYLSCLSCPSCENCPILSCPSCLHVGLPNPLSMCSHSENSVFSYSGFHSHRPEDDPRERDGKTLPEGRGWQLKWCCLPGLKNHVSCVVTPQESTDCCSCCCRFLCYRYKLATCYFYQLLLLLAACYLQFATCLP